VKVHKNFSVIKNNQSTGGEPEISHISGPPQKRIVKARSLLTQASALLVGLGTEYRDVQSLIDECDLMLGRDGCEPFANLAKSQ
jgi:hypothetical protein